MTAVSHLPADLAPTTPTGDPDRPLAHRATFTTRNPDAFSKTRSVTAEWLAGKNYQAPLAPGHHALTDTATLINQVVYNPAGAEAAIRLQLREENTDATWRTTVTAVADNGAMHVAVGLEAFPNPGTLVTPGWPALIRSLVAALQPKDGPAKLTRGTQEISQYDVADLVEILCDPDRRKPALVAARPFSPEPVWSDRMQRAMPLCAGAASLYLLADQDAIHAFRQQIGEDHRVATGSIRTFHPGVDPAWPADAARHRFLAAARLSDPADAAWRSLPNTLHRLATAAPLPDALRTVTFPEVGEAHREARQAAINLVRGTVDAQALQQEVSDLTALLKQADDDLREAGRADMLSQRAIASLEQQNAMLAGQSDADTEEALWALEEAERGRGEAEVLRGLLYAQGRHADAAAVSDTPGAPGSSAELLERAAGLTGVLLTADAQIALSLDENERSRVWAAKTWQGLRALDGYAATHADHAGFYQYCRSGRAAAGWPLTQVAMSESDTTMAHWGDERVFPVPSDVDPDGSTTMQAHLQIERRGSISPRVYFLDDTKGLTGKMIVGYIGPHLTNTKTN